MSLSEEPARKLLVKQCIELTPDTNLELSKRHRKWNLLVKNKYVPVRLIWIQGIIINVSEGVDTITLDDGSSKAYILSAKDAPGYGSWIQKGKYLMVIGEVLSVQPDIKIKAVKLTHLSEVNAEILWGLEVLDFWKFIETS